MLLLFRLAVMLDFICQGAQPKYYALAIEPVVDLLAALLAAHDARVFQHFEMVRNRGTT
jgi:hypothetical protein